MNVLILAPHPDDEAIGCGGTICHHVERGDRVTVVFLTSGEFGLKHLPREEAWRVREKEAQKAAKILGISELTFLRQPDWFMGDYLPQAADALRPVLEKEGPNLIYLPHVKEWHPDHQAVLPILRAAIKQPIAAQLRGYEIWTPLSECDCVENISSVIARKMRAVRAYKSQMTDFRYDRAIAGLNQYRGVIAGKCRFAEAFQSIHLSP